MRMTWRTYSKISDSNQALSQLICYQAFFIDQQIILHPPHTRASSYNRTVDLKYKILIFKTQTRRLHNSIKDYTHVF